MHVIQQCRYTASLHRKHAKAFHHTSNGRVRDALPLTAPNGLRCNASYGGGNREGRPKDLECISRVNNVLAVVLDVEVTQEPEEECQLGVI